MSTMKKEEIQDLAKKCLEVVAGKQTELEATKFRLEGAAEGISFLLNSLTEVMDAAELGKKKKEVASGKSDKPFSTTTKA